MSKVVSAPDADSAAPGASRPAGRGRPEHRAASLRPGPARSTRPAPATGQPGQEMARVARVTASAASPWWTYKEPSAHRAAGRYPPPIRMVLRAAGLGDLALRGEQPALPRRCVALVDGEGAQHEVAQRVGGQAIARSRSRGASVCPSASSRRIAVSRRRSCWSGAELSGQAHSRKVAASATAPCSSSLKGARLDVAGQAVIDLVGGRYPVRERGTCIRPGRRRGAGPGGGGRQVLVHRGAVQRMRELTGVCISPAPR